MSEPQHSPVDETADPPAPEPPHGLVPLLRSLEQLGHEGVGWLKGYGQVARETGELAAIEGRLAALGLLRLLILALLIALTLLLIWLALVGLIATQLHAMNLSPVAIALSLLVAHMLFLGGLIWAAVRTADDLRFKRTRETLGRFRHREEGA